MVRSTSIRALRGPALGVQPGRSTRVSARDSGTRQGSRQYRDPEGKLLSVSPRPGQALGQRQQEDRSDLWLSRRALRALGCPMAGVLAVAVRGGFKAPIEWVACHEIEALR